MNQQSKIAIVAALLGLVGACVEPVSRAYRRREEPERMTRRAQRPWPAYPAAVGKEALRRWTRACFEQALSFNPVFARGGQLVVAWRADRAGDLMQLEFPTDTFFGWEIDRAGRTMASCVVAKARAGKVVWSKVGQAPMRFSATASPPASAPSAR